MPSIRTPETPPEPKPANRAARLSVAPMMDWTDRFCRYFHRLMSREVLLYTEMVTAPAVVHGDHARLLAFDPAEHPVALQLGGSDPRALAAAAKRAAAYGYDEINLNVGCPSDRVQSGAFGAVLMRDAPLVAACCAAMRDAVSTEITVKCRIGVDEQEPSQVLPEFLAQLSASGVSRVTIHARKAWLQGLSPKENRDIPPLDYPLVHEMKALFPHLHISVNGGIDSLDAAQEFLRAGLDGVMIGRAAYHNPYAILGHADQCIYGSALRPKTRHEVIDALLPFVEAERSRGTRLNQITRHILGLYTGCPGARQWRRILSEGAHMRGAGPELILKARSAVAPEA